jgi:hypothetical protein
MDKEKLKNEKKAPTHSELVSQTYELDHKVEISS